MYICTVYTLDFKTVFKKPTICNLNLFELGIGITSSPLEHDLIDLPENQFNFSFILIKCSAGVTKFVTIRFFEFCKNFDVRKKVDDFLTQTISSLGVFYPFFRPKKSFSAKTFSKQLRREISR